MAFPASGLCVPTFVGALGTTQLALDLDLETHKVALYTNSVSGADMTTDTAYGVGAWNANEVSNSGTNYATGGIAVTTSVWAHVSGGVVAWTAANPSWATASFTARGALYYADVLAGNNIIMCQTFGADITATAGTFLITLGASLFSVDLVP